MRSRSAIALIGDVRGLGMFIGVELVRRRATGGNRGRGRHRIGDSRHLDRHGRAVTTCSRSSRRWCWARRRGAPRADAGIGARAARGLKDPRLKGRTRNGMAGRGKTFKMFVVQRTLQHGPQGLRPGRGRPAPGAGRAAGRADGRGEGAARGTAADRGARARRRRARGQRRALARGRADGGGGDDRGRAAAGGGRGARRAGGPQDGGAGARGRAGGGRADARGGAAGADATAASALPRSARGSSTPRGSRRRPRR